MAKLDDAFLAYACDILADTNAGLSGMKIVEYCLSWQCKSAFLPQCHLHSLSCSFWGVTLPKPLVDFRHEAIRACSITEV